MPSTRHALARPLSALAAACALMAATAALAPASAAAARVRTRGPAVVLLQHRLHLSPDGVYGPATQRAVRRFQRRHGLTPDGLVGPATWRALHVRGSHPVLKRAHLHPPGARRHRGARHHRRSHHARVERRGGAVRALQRRLGLAPDGVFGPETGRRVRAFQRRHGLTADGIVGPATWAALGVRGTSTVLKPAHLRAGGGGGGGGGMPGVVRRLIHAANRINSLPYVYGGGHGSFTASGYDCSGSVSYALHGAGLLASPLDSGQLMSWGVPGRGRWVTVYSNPGHAYMVVGHRRFDTSGANPSRWQTDMRSSAGYVARHPAGL